MSIFHCHLCGNLRDADAEDGAALTEDCLNIVCADCVQSLEQGQNAVAPKFSVENRKRFSVAIEPLAVSARDAALDLLEACLQARRVNAIAAAYGYLAPEKWGDEMAAVQQTMSAAIAKAGAK